MTTLDLANTITTILAGLAANPAATYRSDDALIQHATRLAVDVHIAADDAYRSLTPHTDDRKETNQ